VHLSQVSSEEAALERDPDNFDPSVRLRDYDAIDLPVFTVSARDYVRITGKRNFRHFQE
jgi:hypothetical protein